MSMYRSVQATEPWHLVRKVLLLFLLVVAVAFGLVYLLERGGPAPTTMFNLLADGSIGAVAGFGTRMVLRRRNWFIRSVVAASLSIVGLVLLGYLTDARSGVGPLNVRLHRVNWLNRVGIALRVPEIPGNSRTDLMDVAHMVIAVNLSWIALRAWRGRARVQEYRQEPDSWPDVYSPASPAASPVRAAVSVPARAAVVRPTTRGRARPVLRTRRGGGRVLVTRATPVRSRGRNLFRRRRAVQLAAYEEHRCPYCLQDIKRDDLRVECPICHTLHHKDCWDITGTCQIPHQNG